MERQGGLIPESSTVTLSNWNLNLVIYPIVVVFVLSKEREYQRKGGEKKMPSYRPGVKQDIREKYKKWSQKFRLSVSNRTLPLRPHTVRGIFLRKHKEELKE